MLQELAALQALLVSQAGVLLELEPQGWQVDLQERLACLIASTLPAVESSAKRHSLRPSPDLLAVCSPRLN